MNLSSIALIVFVLFFPWNVHADVQTHLNELKKNPNELYAFFKDMPKGGELHYHLAGGAYPETMLSLAQQHNYCFDTKTLSIHKPAEKCHGLSSKDLFLWPEVYEKIIRAWSMKEFKPGKESGHDHFFETFYKFMPLVADFRPQLLAEVMQRAANQHEHYMEIMILPDDAKSSAFGPLVEHHSSLQDKKNILLADKAFQQNISHTVRESKRILQVARQQLGCDAKPNQPVCQLSVKFQYYVLREQSLDRVFAQALNGFVAASQSSELVAVNLVQAEDGLVSLRDYHKQMKLFKFLHEQYPTVHIALHAGELEPHSVSPHDLSDHIHEAVFTGKAERIGHGVDIAYEEKAKALLKHMAINSIPVEINLTSNKKILNIHGKRHPLAYYINHQIPIVLSTDDEGILRTDLTHEFVNAVLVHDLDYKTIKTINRNVLTFAFIPGKSLWSDAVKGRLVSSCSDLNSQTCHTFIKQSPKATLQWQLEQQLIAFEKQYDV